MRSTREIAAALGGQVAGPNTVLCPGPGHSAHDRSLAVRLDHSAPDGFLVHSHAGADWRACRDHVHERLGLPAWEAGDGLWRTIPQRHAYKWDLAAIEQEVNEEPRAWNEDELVPIAAARRIWNEAQDPRQTLGQRCLNGGRKLHLPGEVAGRLLRFYPCLSLARRE
jgi:putative DNA primase/helicase